MSSALGRRPSYGYSNDPDVAADGVRPGSSPSTSASITSLDELTTSNTLLNVARTNIPTSQNGERSRANSVVASFWPMSSGQGQGQGHPSRAPRGSVGGPMWVDGGDDDSTIKRRKSYVELDIDGTDGSDAPRYRSSQKPINVLNVRSSTLRSTLRAPRRILVLLLLPISVYVVYRTAIQSRSMTNDSSVDAMAQLYRGSWIGETARGAAGIRYAFGKLIGAHGGEWQGEVPARKNPLKTRIPLKSFRDNLRDDHGYVTSFPYGGTILGEDVWAANQLMEILKLVHLGQLLNRDVILSELMATHEHAPNVGYSKFFDLDLFSFLTNVSIMEWQEVKIPLETGTSPEKLSCWGWQDNAPLKGYNVQTFFWPPPGQLTVPSSIQTSMSFPAMEVLASQSNRKWLDESAQRIYGGWENAPDPPDTKLMCFENLFYVPSIHFVEGAVDQSYTIEELSPNDPVWTSVGQHLHYNAHISHIADELLTFLMGRSGARKPFIGVHLRRGDFVSLGRIAGDDVGSYTRAVTEVQSELRKNRKWSGIGGKRDLPVIFATDATDDPFLNKLADLGWLRINHQEFATDVRFGGWYPSMLDSLLLSRAVGFVGTKSSTYSYLTARRVETWNDGVTRIAG
ncbi:BZ3500_MvSof-1268-A1-R1_Chr1-3g01604 [Microbotryum saponariae]|uniref:BZ3500_MvSof-1268-A1-R1_Chr1-3g01604 protein n=1 Tax=Microbotryum saponariae TaxID=289078 RepID=A0A2X0M6D2_9BASI|nr:BZ3500_MvSof-1268-A1-R1_Chr1-3g01604 [Microbotryum saponariae]SCZ94120.1 BZ3501_MvSof-1269-A2-R1_Chr1-3g01205 [Microbotryum saponariae]